MIHLDNISKYYGQQRALSDISFSMERGDIIGLLGVNGAGKSTLMKILAGIILPDTGRISINGNDFTPEANILKRQIGYLSEDNPLYEDMYVKEYLSYVADIYKADRNRIHYLIERLGLEKEYRKKISTLSKGNRQRVGIAQAMINDPQFLIVDEATSGLDPNQRERLNVLFKEIAPNTIILFSTHILHEVKDLCTRVIIIDGGKIQADERVENIDSIEQTFYTLTHENSSR